MNEDILIGGSVKSVRKSNIAHEFKHKYKATDYEELFSRTNTRDAKAIFLAVFFKSGDRDTVRTILNSLERLNHTAIIAKFKKLVVGELNLREELSKVRAYEEDKFYETITKIYNSLLV